MSFKSWMFGFSFTLIAQWAMAEGGLSNDPFANFFGAVLKGATDQTPADQKTGKPVRKFAPLSGLPLFFESEIEEINSKALATRASGSVNYQDNLNACWAAAKEVTGLDFRVSGAPEFCLRRLSIETQSDVKKRDAARSAAFLQEREDKEKDRVASYSSMREQSEAIAKRIENGDASAWGNCSKETSGKDTTVEFYNTCIPIAQPALIRALRAKKFPPDNCRKWALANTVEGTALPSVMRVSIASDAKLGTFSGEVVQIDGKTLTVYDRNTRSNAIAVVDGKTQIFNGDQVAVGLTIYGVGVQTATRQVTLASGQASSVAVISAKCIGDF